MDHIRRLKQQLSKEFDMKDLGLAKKILGMQITRDKQKGVLQLSCFAEIQHGQRQASQHTLGKSLSPIQGLVPLDGGSERLYG